MNSNPICHPSPANKMKCFFLDYVHFWWSAWLIDELEPHLPPLSYQKMKCSIFDYVQLLMIGWAGKWTQTPSFTPLQTKKWNAHILIMFNFWWLARLVNGLKPNPPLLSSQKKWNAHFWITVPSDDLPGWLMNLNLICHPSYQKNEMLNFWLHSTSDDQPSWSIDSNPICHPSPANKMKCFFLDYVHFWWSARLVNWLKPHLPPLSSQ